MKQLIKYVVVCTFFVLFFIDANACGFIIVKRHPQGPVNLKLRSENVNVIIDDVIATTEVTQVFYNPLPYQNVEGYFYFPLPKGSVIKDFSMYINGKKMQAEMLDAKKAKKIYEDIVRQQRDPALLEFGENNVMKVRIFPIAPKSEKKITIKYIEKLERNNGTTTYQYLLKNKYVDTSKINELVFHINMKSNDEIKNIFSPTHDLDIVRKNKNSAKISFESNRFISDDVLKLFYAISNDKLGHSMLSFKPENENGFFMSNISPGLKNNPIPKDLAIVFDASGSMSGKKLEKTKNAIQFILNSLNKEDRFNLIRFSTEATALFDKLHDGNKTNINEAITFLNRLKALGGTNIEEALHLAFQQKTNSNKPFHILFITDGKPTIGEINHHKLLESIKEKNIKNTKIFTLGIGTDVNTHLLDKLAKNTKAFRSYVLPKEDIEVKISNFYTKIANPALTDLEITFKNNVKVMDLYPKNLPDLFYGESISIFGRFVGAKESEIEISGKINGETKKWTFKADFQNHKKENDYIAQLWAVRSVAYMLEQIRLNGNNTELKEEIVKLAKEYGIITPYTSYLILEDEQTNTRSNNQNSNFTEDFMDLKKQEINHDVAVVNEKISVGYKSVRKSKEYNIMSNIESKRAMMNNQYEMQNNKIQNIKMILNSGRVFYQNFKNQWVDSWIEKNQNLKQVIIKFGSDEYFKLLKDYPKSAKIMSLGTDIQFVMNNIIYNIVSTIQK